MTKRLRLAITIGLVGSAALVAWAASPGDGEVTATPTIAVAVQAVGAGSSASFQLATPGTTDVAVAGLVQDATSCDDPAIHLQSTSGFTLVPGTPHAETVVCPATAAAGMRRCLFHARDGSDRVLASFLGVCLTYQTQALAAVPSSVQYASVPLGTRSAPQTIMLTNTGSTVTGPLHLQVDDDLGEDYLIGAPCTEDGYGCETGAITVPHGSSVAVQVMCRPATTSPRPGHLYAAVGGTALATPVQLSCTGAAASGPVIDVTTTPAPLDLGAVEVSGGTTAQGVVHLRNVGTATLSVSGVSITQVGSDWSYTFAPPCSGSSCDVPPGGANDLALTFQPGALGGRSATLQIMSNAVNGQANVTLAGTGLGATLEDLADPQTIDLGDAPRDGSTPPYAIHLLNRGNRDLTDTTVVLSPAAGFSVTPTSPTVSFLTGATLQLTCTPAGAAGPLSTTLTVSAPDTVTTTPVTLQVTCTPTDAALVASPSAIALGEIRTGTAPAMQAILLHDVGSDALTLDAAPALSPSVPALAVSGPAMLGIPAGGAAQVELTVTPTSDGDLGTELTASEDLDPGYTLEVPITGTMVTAAASVPSSVNLGTFCVGQETSPATLDLTASGTATIALTSPPRLLQGPTSPFALVPKVPSAYPAVLAPGEHAAIDVRPVRRTTPGSVGDTVQWQTDIASAPSPATTVSATFLDTGTAIAPATLDFGDVAVHLPPNDAMPVTLQNCSDAPIALTATIDPPFQLDASEFPASLMPGQTATFGVSFQPAQITHYEGHLRVATDPDQGMLSVELVGNGVAGSGGGDGGAGGGNGLPETSFYACSCTSSSPGGGLPIVLALAAVIVRRRRGSSSAR